MNDNDGNPEKSLLFEPVKDAYGNRLALVMGNEFRNGACPFYKKQCVHCDIGRGEGIEFNYALNMQRLTFFKTYYQDILPDVAHLVFYNSGSTLNKKELSTETLKEMLKFASSLENCKVVSFDSREHFMTETNIQGLVKNLRDDQQVRIILGLETQNDTIRINHLEKIMTKSAVEQAFATIGEYEGKVGIDINVIFQPPKVIGREAIIEATKTIKYGLDLSKKYNVPVDFNFHPYYPSQKSLIKFPNHPRANLKDTIQAINLIKIIIDAQNSDAKVFIGWQDETHDQEQPKRKKELEKYVKKFDYFNNNQNLIKLKSKGLIIKENRGARLPTISLGTGHP